MNMKDNKKISSRKWMHLGFISIKRFFVEFVVIYNFEKNNNVRVNYYF